MLHKLFAENAKSRLRRAIVATQTFREERKIASRGAVERAVKTVTRSAARSVARFREDRKIGGKRKVHFFCFASPALGLAVSPCVSRRALTSSSPASDDACQCMLGWPLQPENVPRRAVPNLGALGRVARYAHLLELVLHSKGMIL